MAISGSTTTCHRRQMDAPVRFSSSVTRTVGLGSLPAFPSMSMMISPWFGYAGCSATLLVTSWRIAGVGKVVRGEEGGGRFVVEVSVWRYGHGRDGGRGVGRC